MKRNQRKIWIGVLWIIILMGGISVSASKDTGHPDFNQIYIPSGSSAKLLVDMTPHEKDMALQKVNRKAFGWRIHAINRNAKVTYLSNTVFARANNTGKPVDFAYELTTGQSVETSVSVNGSITTKVSGKIKVVTAALDVLIRGEIGRKIKTFYEEQTNFKVTIYPRTKVSLLVKGDAKLSNGAGKYYLLGICFRKGMWEYVDVVNEYYELYEENLAV